MYNIDYSKLENSYRQYLKLNRRVMSFIISIYNFYNIILISNSSAKRVHADLKKIKMQKYFNKVYTKEDGIKQNHNYIEKILKENNIDLMIYIGNDKTEDLIENERVVSLLIQNEDNL